MFVKPAGSDRLAPTEDTIIDAVDPTGPGSSPPRTTFAARLDEERLRLASELHDIVGHGLVAIQMQADLSRHLRATRPEQAHIALDAISRTAAEALADLRTALATITHPPAHGPAHVAADATRATHGAAGPCGRDPAPGLHLLESLCGRIEQAGVTVDVTVHGEWRPLPEVMDVAAYRILQESLTNVVKHSARPLAVIEIGYLPDAISLRVGNEIGPSDPGVDGFGIAGMRRRVTQIGGRLTAGTARPGRFEVYATIPTPAE
jgi:signal transduction histidine kinase